MLDTPIPLEHLYDEVRTQVPLPDWLMMADDVAAIERLKREKNALILAHNYQVPEIFGAVADIVGDSLALARQSADAQADVIVMAGVHFMAETAKLLNPSKTVLIPDLAAGCSLADFDHGAGCARPARRASGRADHHLCEHLGGGKGRIGHLLHLGQCAQDRRGAGRAARHHDPR